MRSHAQRPATPSPRSTEHAESCAARRPAPASHLFPASSTELGHRFEKIAIDPVRSGGRQANEGVARLRPAAWSAPIQRKQVWNGVWLGEGDEGRRERELEEERQRERERQRQVELQRQEEERRRQLELRQREEERQRLLEQERQRQEEEERQRRLEEERQRQVEQQRREEERLQLEEERRRQLMLEQQRKMEEERRPRVEEERHEPSRRNYGSISQPSSSHLRVNRDSRSDSEDEEGMNVPLMGQQRPSRWSRFKNWVSGSLDSNAANFVSINSPGTQTGLVGGSSGVNSLLTPPKQIPRTSGYLNATGNYTTGVGAGLNALGMGSDLVASAQGLNNMSKEGGVRGFFRGIRDTFSRRRNETGTQAETRSTAKRLAVDLPVNLADAGSQGMQMGNAISSLTHAGTSVLPSVLGTASAGIGVGVQGIVAARAGWRFGRAWHHKRAVDRVSRDFDRRDDVHPEMKAAAKHMSTQLGKRRARSLIGGLGATAGAVGGGLLLAGLLGGAAMLTPIGWGLAGAGALVAAGLGIHKLYRHYKKKKAGTLGTERQTHADNLHRAVTNPLNAQHKIDALAILKSHGVTESQASDPDKGQQLIRRKLEGW